MENLERASYIKLYNYRCVCICTHIYTHALYQNPKAYVKSFTLQVTSLISRELTYFWFLMADGITFKWEGRLVERWIVWEL